ncbi:uncharacterized protein G2W53_019066 [Senna tora]|uniref:Uncharacterized protein n=1 Tax=Senna tora TaxID=362788 RepID=A0A834WLZ2_9FABA|nr:uncharacterized protein G2W53_019066 [Senna tora]
MSVYGPSLSQSKAKLSGPETLFGSLNSW